MTTAQILDIPVSDIMTKDVMILDRGDLLRDAINTFNNHNIRHAPVVFKNELVGMLSWIDLERLPTPSLLKSEEVAIGNEAPRYITVGQAMTPDPVSVQVGDPVRDIARIFTESDFHALPVLDGERIVGIISTTDLIRFFLEELGA